MLLTDADYGLSPGGIGPLLSRIPEGITGASKAGQDYSELGLTSLDLPASFSGRTAASTQTFSVSDTASISVTESPVGQNEIATYDTVSLSVSETASLFNNIAVSDTASISLSETLSLVQSGVIPKTGTDTVSISVTDTAALNVSVVATDTASISLTDTSTVVVSTEQKTASDTVSISVDDASLLEIFAGVNAVTASDTCSLTLGETANVAEVRRIKRIALSITHPRIEMEIS